MTEQHRATTARTASLLEPSSSSSSSSSETLPPPEGLRGRTTAARSLQGGDDKNNMDNKNNKNDGKNDNNDNADDDDGGGVVEQQQQPQQQQQEGDEPEDANGKPQQQQQEDQQQPQQQDVDNGNDNDNEVVAGDNDAPQDDNKDNDKGGGGGKDDKDKDKGKDNDNEDVAVATTSPSSVPSSSPSRLVVRQTYPPTMAPSLAAIDVGSTTMRLPLKFSVYSVPERAEPNDVDVVVGNGIDGIDLDHMPAVLQALLGAFCSGGDSAAEGEDEMLVLSSPDEIVCLPSGNATETTHGLSLVSASDPLVIAVQRVEAGQRQQQQYYDDAATTDADAITDTDLQWNAWSVVYRVTRIGYYFRQKALLSNSSLLDLQEEWQYASLTLMRESLQAHLNAKIADGSFDKRLQHQMISHYGNNASYIYSTDVYSSVTGKETETFAKYVPTDPPAYSVDDDGGVSKTDSAYSPSFTGRLTMRIVGAAMLASTLAGYFTLLLLSKRRRKTRQRLIALKEAEEDGADDIEADKVALIGNDSDSRVGKDNSDEQGGGQSNALLNDTLPSTEDDCPLIATGITSGRIVPTRSTDEEYPRPQDADGESSDRKILVRVSAADYDDASDDEDFDEDGNDVNDNGAPSSRPNSGRSVDSTNTPIQQQEVADAYSAVAAIAGVVGNSPTSTVSSMNAAFYSPAESLDNQDDDVDSRNADRNNSKDDEEKD